MKQAISLLFFLMVVFFNTQSQTVPTLKPVFIEELDFSERPEDYYYSREAQQACDELLQKMEEEGRSAIYGTQKEKKILSYCGQVSKQAIWDVLGGCSWYCGGGPKKVTASSTLKPQGNQTYKVDNVHDLKYNTAWVEGAPGQGIGAFLEYSFDAMSPRVNTINVVNGYVKSPEAYQNNGRVKKLKMYINNKAYAILELNDQVAIQSFEVEPIGNRGKKKSEIKPWKLKFEIMDVYKGDKYDDVAITELYFDGLDVHCLGKGSRVLMFDGTEKRIEDLKEGDVIAYMDFSSGELKPSTIEKLAKATHHGLVRYQFKSGTDVVATQDHPFKLIKKGWASLKPTQTHQYKGFEKAGLIQPGDLFYTTKGFDRLESISYLDGEAETYTITKLSQGNHFIANGMMVGVEE